MALHANVSEYADNAGRTLSYVLAAEAIDAFRENHILLPFMRLGEFPANSKVFAFPLETALTSAAVAESADATPQVNATTKASLTMGKYVTLLQVTDESFTAGAISTEYLRNKIVPALRDGLEVAIATLFAGLSTSVGSAAADIEPVDAIDASYEVRVENAPGERVLVISPLQLQKLQTAILTTSSSVYANPSFNTVVGRLNATNLAGQIGDLPVYVTSNVQINTGAEVGAVLVPNVTFGAAFPMNVTDVFQFKQESGDDGMLGGAEWVKGSLFFGAGELKDAAGCKVLSDDNIP